MWWRLRHGIGTEPRFLGFPLPQQRPQVDVARGVGPRAIQPVDAEDAIGLGKLAGRDHRVDGGRDVAFVLANDRDLVALGHRLEAGEAFCPGDGHLDVWLDEGVRGGWRWSRIGRLNDDSGCVDAWRGATAVKDPAIRTRLAELSSTGEID